jgi:hypothetical protein
MLYKIQNQKKALELIGGTSLKGNIIGPTYSNLVEIMGEPTFLEESGDGKIQKQWVIRDGGEIFTIYDWKTYDKEYTENILVRWNVGGKSYAGNFIEKIEKKIQEKFGNLI